MASSLDYQSELIKIWQKRFSDLIAARVYEGTHPSGPVPILVLLSGFLHKKGEKIEWYNIDKKKKKYSLR
jgi:hypothetical protein